MSYIAWNGDEYPGEPPEGWTIRSDGRAWPEGYGPLEVAPASPSDASGVGDDESTVVETPAAEEDAPEPDKDEVSEPSPTPAESPAPAEQAPPAEPNKPTALAAPTAPAAVAEPVAPVVSPEPAGPIVSPEPAAPVVSPEPATPDESSAPPQNRGVWSTPVDGSADPPAEAAAPRGSRSKRPLLIAVAVLVVVAAAVAGYFAFGPPSQSGSEDDAAAAANEGDGDAESTAADEADTDDAELDDQDDQADPAGEESAGSETEDGPDDTESETDGDNGLAGEASSVTPDEISSSCEILDGSRFVMQVENNGAEPVDLYFDLNISYDDGSSSADVGNVNYARPGEAIRDVQWLLEPSAAASACEVTSTAVFANETADALSAGQCTLGDPDAFGDATASIEIINDGTAETTFTFLVGFFDASGTRTGSAWASTPEALAPGGSDSVDIVTFVESEGVESCELLSGSAATGS